METRRFSRSKNVRIAGVCAGLAEYTGISVSLMRVLWVLFAIFTWFWLAVIAYVVLAFVMPSPDGAPEGERFWQNIQGRNVMMVIALMLICAGGLIMVREFLPVNLDKFFFPIGLIIGGGMLMAFAFGTGRNKQQ